MRKKKTSFQKVSLNAVGAGHYRFPPFFLFLRFSGFRERDFFAAVCDPPHAAEDHASEGDKIRDVRQNPVGQHRQRILGNVGAVSECLEWNRR